MSEFFWIIQGFWRSVVVSRAVMDRFCKRHQDADIHHEARRGRALQHQ